MSWRQKLVAATDRLTSLGAERLHVHVDFPLFQRLAPPIPSGRSQIPGIQIQDTRRMRLLEVLLHGGPQLGGWRTAQMQEAIGSAFTLSAETYPLTPLRYELRKGRARGGCNAMAGVTATGSRKKDREWLPCSSGSTSASVARWPTRGFLIGQRRPPRRPPRSRLPITGADEAIQKLIQLLAA